MLRIVVDLDFGGRLEGGRGVTYLARGDRRNGEVPADLRKGQELLLADYDARDDLVGRLPRRRRTVEAGRPREAPAEVERRTPGAPPSA